MTSIPNLSILHLNVCFAVNNTDPTVTTISLGLDKDAHLLVKLHIALLGQDQSTHAEIPLSLYEIAEKLL